MPDPLGPSARDVDVLVIGAGPAGAAAAHAGALRGADVLLVDRAEWPRSKVCGCCVNPAGVDALNQMGALAHAAPPVVRLSKLRLRSGASTVNLELDAGIAVERSALDDAAVHAARRAGARFRSRTSAKVLSRCGSGWRVRLADDEITARVVVACDGLTGSSLAAVSGAERLAPRVEPASWMGAGVLVPADRAHRWHDAVAAGEVAMHVADDAYVGLVRLADGGVDIAAALDAARAKAAGGPACAIGDILAAAGIADAHARLGGESVHGAGLLTRRRPRPAAPGLIIAGDAAGYVEPFTGEGITWALVQGEQAGTFAADAAANDALWAGLEHDWPRWLASVIAPRRRSCRVVRWTLRHPRVRRGLGETLAASALARTAAAAFVRRAWRPYPKAPEIRTCAP